MKVIRINPQGYCKGVIEALNIVKEIKEKNVYILGQIIHNNNIYECLKERGFIIIEGNSRIEMINQIPDNSTVVFSAHGVSPIVYEIAKKKNLKVIDATCKKVHEIHEKIKEIKKSKKIIYIGKKNHAETEGVLGIDPEIILFDDLNNPPKLDKDTKYFVTNQTTLSILKLNYFYEYLKNYDCEIDNSICMATTIRQKAVINAPSCDLFIVVGDPNSSNTTELYNLAKKRFNTIKLESIEDLNLSDLVNVSTVCITSGASTPKKIVDQIIEYLTNFSYNINAPRKKVKDLL